jgi:hypothetical protein
VAKRKRGEVMKEMIQLDIINDETGDQEIANYEVALILPSEIHHIRVEGFARREGWAALVRRAVEELEREMHVA